jgi:hypothetical protein
MRRAHFGWLLLFFFTASAMADETPSEETPKAIELTRKWTTLFLLSPRDTAERDIPEGFPVSTVDELELVGPHPGHPHMLGEFKVDGRYRFRDGLLRREGGNSALLRLPAAASFDVEGQAQVGSLGGCLLLLGWDESHNSGYCIYHTQMKVSGSLWYLCEFKDGKVVEGSDREMVRKEVSGYGALKLTMDGKKLTFMLGGESILRNQELPNYEPGGVYIGTFGPRYGPKDISLRSLRMRLR